MLNYNDTGPAYMSYISLNVSAQAFISVLFVNYAVPLTSHYIMLLRVQLPVKNRKELISELNRRLASSSYPVFYVRIYHAPKGGLSIGR